MKSISLEGVSLVVIVFLAFCGGCAATGTSTQAAVGPESSWDEIRSTPGLVVNAPMIPFGARAVAVTDVCRSGDTLRATAADGTKLETPGAGHRSNYTIAVGRIVGDGESSKFRALFVKPFDIPPCA